MKCILLLAGLALFGCSKEEDVVVEPVEDVRVEIMVGEAYEDVLEKLGKPNIDSSSEQSRILIYDEMELKLQSNVVVEVFDHRSQE